MSNRSLTERLEEIAKLQAEIVQKWAVVANSMKRVTQVDHFIIGALRRTLAQADGFRSLIATKNFPCAAGILRMQIDTAMRINALSLVADVEAACSAMMSGQKFDKLKDREGKRLQDFHIRGKLAEKYPWINPIYERASDFVHLSSGHFEVSISHTVDAERMVYFQVSGTDPNRPEETYYEIVDAFFEATKLSGMTILAFSLARHQRDELLKRMETDRGMPDPAE